MNFIKERRKAPTIFVLILMLTFIFFGNTFIAKADTFDDTLSVQEIVDKSLFITFKKGNDATKGKYMAACYYVPNEAYNSAYTYGGIIFPKDYGLAYGLTGNYLKVVEEKGLAILNLTSTTPLPEENGKGMSFGIMGMNERNLDRTFAFIFYVKDIDGNVAYMEPQFAVYNNLSVGELTSEELIGITEQVKGVQKGFGGIVEKIQELVNSIWGYVVIALSSVIVVWGVYIAIKIVIAKKNEEKINAKGMVKSLCIGVVIVFVLAMGLPLLINGLSHWVKW